MGYVNAVMDALQNVGIRTERAYPGRRMQVITTPVAAVSLEQEDHISGAARVRISIVSPAQLGGPACEDMAKKAARAVAALGNGCVQEACTFEAQADHYCAAVYVSFGANAFTVRQEGMELPAAVCFEAWLNEEGIWQIRLEEVFLPGQEEVLQLEAPFRLTVDRAKSAEVFEGCTWTKVQRTDEKDKLRQIRTGTAAGRSYTGK